MKHPSRLGLLLAAALAFPALAQTPYPTTAPTTARDRLQRGLAPSYHHSVAREIQRAIKLNDAQLDALAALTDHHQETATVQRRTMRQMRNKLELLRAAERDRDESTATTLRTEVEALRTTRATQAAEGDPYELFMGDVDSILTPEQRPQFAAFQTRFLERGFFGGRIYDIIENLPKQLAITAEQRSAYDELRAKLRAAVPHPRWAAADPSDYENDVLAAEEEGDYETADAMRAKASLATANPRLVLEDFFRGLEPKLNSDQLHELMKVRQGTIDPLHARQASVKTLLRTARRLKLTPEQEDQLRTIETEQMRKARALQGQDEPLQALSAETRTRIEQLLTAEQRTQFAGFIAHAAGRDGG